MIYAGDFTLVLRGVERTTINSLLSLEAQLGPFNFGRYSVIAS